VLVFSPGAKTDIFHLRFSQEQHQPQQHFDFREKKYYFFFASASFLYQMSHREKSKYILIKKRGDTLISESQTQ
jgi:hypothetical protein